MGTLGGRISDVIVLLPPPPQGGGMLIAVLLLVVGIWDLMSDEWDRGSTRAKIGPTGEWQPPPCSPFAYRYLPTFARLIDRINSYTPEILLSGALKRYSGVVPTVLGLAILLAELSGCPIPVRER